MWDSLGSVFFFFLIIKEGDQVFFRMPTRNEKPDWKELKGLQQLLLIQTHSLFNFILL